MNYKEEESNFSIDEIDPPAKAMLISVSGKKRDNTQDLQVR